MTRWFGIGLTAVMLLAACSGGGSSSPAPVAGTPTGGSPGGPVVTPSSSSPSAAAAAARLGKPSRLLVGLGAGGDTADIRAQGLKPDVLDRYLVGPWPGSVGWPDWNQPRGAYVDLVAAEADAVGAVPMFTLYQLEVRGEANMDVLKDSAFMTQVWTDTRLLFQRLGAYGKPAVVHLEPDFWGFTLRAASGNPSTVPVLVTIAGECADLSNDLKGMVGCMLRMARTLAPRTLVGFSPSDWEFTPAQNVAWFKALGADKADLLIMQTLDRDAGCIESAGPGCQHLPGGTYYWDASNATTPNFAQHLALARTYHDGIGLPLLWWQTPLGVPSATAGTVGRYRDNRMQYFLTHPAELVAAGGLGVVFGAGADDQTTLKTDGGQYQRLSSAYLAAPVALP